MKINKIPYLFHKVGTLWFKSLLAGIKTVMGLSFLHYLANKLLYDGNEFFRFTFCDPQMYHLKPIHALFPL
ncbi:MAG: hypothetical protein BA873_05775 [Desulfobulbaceae bacterium C00003063]|nr:MAG: hypothetical protein BA873_05775 [Desulfobulbaceae bacterium C00003063]